MLRVWTLTTTNFFFYIRHYMGQFARTPTNLTKQLVTVQYLHVKKIRSKLIPKVGQEYLHVKKIRSKLIPKVGGHYRLNDYQCFR